MNRSRDHIGEAKAHCVDLWIYEKNAREQNNLELAEEIKKCRESTENYVKGQEFIKNQKQKS